MIKNTNTLHMMCILISLSLSLFGMENSTKYNPENTKFAFDFHGVTVTDPFLYMSDLKNALGWNAIPACNQQLPWFVYDVLKLMIYNPSGEGFRNLCTQHEQHDLVTCIMDFTNDVTILTETIDILKELKTKGYELDLASNIDMLFLQDLENNGKYAHIKDILALFTNKKTIDCSTIHITKPIKKPDIRYFTQYQEEYNADNKHIIFVDDRLENVTASQKANMIGIHFQNPKQFRNELVNYGIL